MCTIHWKSVNSGSPGDDKGIENLPGCKECGTILIYFFISFLRSCSAGVLYPTGAYFYQLQ